MDGYIPNINSNAIAGPAGPSGASSYGDVSVGGLTVNKKPDWLMMGAAFVLGGLAVWAYKSR